MAEPLTEEQKRQQAAIIAEAMAAISGLEGAAMPAEFEAAPAPALDAPEAMEAVLQEPAPAPELPPEAMEALVEAPEAPDPALLELASAAEAAQPAAEAPAGMDPVKFAEMIAAEERDPGSYLSDLALDPAAPAPPPRPTLPQAAPPGLNAPQSPQKPPAAPQAAPKPPRKAPSAAQMPVSGPESLQIGPAAARGPVEDPIWAALMAQGQPQATPVKLPAPPKAQARDKGALGVAAVLDLMLNRGRNAGRLLAAMAAPDNTAMENYSRQVGHAKALADLNRARGGAGRDPLSQMLAIERLKLAREKFGLSGTREERIAKEQAARRRVMEARAEYERQLRDPNSDATKRARALAMEFAGDDPALRSFIESATAEDIAKWRPQIGQRLAQEHRQEHQLDMEDLRQSNRKEILSEREEQQKDKEQRERERKLARTQIPGWHRDPSMGAPTDQVHVEAVTIADALGEAQYAAAELAKLHEQMDVLTRLGKIGSLSSAERGAMLGRARLLHHELQTAARQLAKMGVPQQYELELLNKVLPMLDSIEGFINAGNVYGFLPDEYDRKADRRMQKLGYLRGDAPASAAPPRRSRRSDADMTDADETFDPVKPDPAEPEGFIDYYREMPEDQLNRELDDLEGL